MLPRLQTCNIPCPLTQVDDADKAKEEGAAKTRQGRDARAEEYLEALKKNDPAADRAKREEWNHHAVPVTSRKNPVYVDAEKMRDLEAKVDIHMLKKGAVLVEKHHAMEAVKLQPVVVHGDDKLARERAIVDKVSLSDRPAAPRISCDLNARFDNTGV